MDNCPNCGAPITDAVCEYCGTHHVQHAEQVTIDIKNDYTDIVSWDCAKAFRILTKRSVKVVGE